jgi:hypothetical protein
MADIKNAHSIADALMLLHDPLKLNGHLPSRERNEFASQFFMDKSQRCGFQARGSFHVQKIGYLE